MNVTINIYGDVHIHCDCCDERGVYADDLEESPEVPYEDAPDTEDDSEEIELSHCGSGSCGQGSGGAALSLSSG